MVKSFNFKEPEDVCEYMRMVFERNSSRFHDLSYILSSERCFFYRFGDGGFKDKWTGIWAPPNKYVEYLAFSIDGEWLSPENAIKLVSEGETSAHEYSIRDMKIKETIRIPEKGQAIISTLELENTTDSDRTVDILLELGINIRSRETNWHDSIYERSIQGSRVFVRNERGCVVFESSPTGNIQSSEQYKDHHPSGELQRCYIPGEYLIHIELPAKSKVPVTFLVACGRDKNDALMHYDIAKADMSNSSRTDSRKKRRNIKSTIMSNIKFDSGVKDLDSFYSMNVASLEKLCADNKLGFGYYAGLPWFTQFWGRDLGWMIPAIIDYGNFENAKKALKTLVFYQSDSGEIPNTIYMDGHVDYNSIDATLLWIMSLNHYIMNSADVRFLKEIKKRLDLAMNWCKSNDADNDGYLEHDNKKELNKGTWMDTRNRGERAVEIQAFWIEAMKAASNLYGILGDKKRKENLRKDAAELEARFEEDFWDYASDFYYDRISHHWKDDSETINPVFPLMFNISTRPEEVLKRFRSDEFKTEHSGPRTLSKYDEAYIPSGYHTGSAWGFTTFSYACAEFLNNQPEKGLEILEKMSRKMGENCAGAIGELWDSETNEPLGCCLQGWSCSMAIICIDEFMLGLKIDALDNSILVSPSIPDRSHIKRVKRIGDDWVIIDIERKGSIVNVDYKSSKNREYRVVINPRK